MFLVKLKNLTIKLNTPSPILKCRVIDAHRTADQVREYQFNELRDRSRVTDISPNINVTCFNN